MPLFMGDKGGAGQGSRIQGAQLSWGPAALQACAPTEPLRTGPRAKQQHSGVKGSKEQHPRPSEDRTGEEVVTPVPCRV